MLIFLEILKYFLFFRICIIDIKRRIIEEKSFIMLIIMGFAVSCMKNDIERWYIGICVYSMPLLILYIAEDYAGKVLIGFGDVKLMMAIGGIFGYRNMESLAEFYTVLYLISGAAAVFLLVYSKARKIKAEYIPFAPFIVFAYIVMQW